MKTYFPYYFKKVGILFVFIAIILSCVFAVDDFNRGFISAAKDLSISSLENPNLDNILKYTPYFTNEEAKPWLNASLILSLIGFTLYLFSKEKIEDEFYQQLRSKSLIQALFVTWIFTGLMYWLGPDYEVKGFYILQLHLIFFTIIYVYNKRWKFWSE
ncbi:hypothetical protein [Marinifilum fragile]|uniref:hypothetical protein n=1 Tax=Marinifilum fragile TaxID=570161 RepID=UPI002AA71921|nr:hypothetical protein [Marinifilum fragile]